MEVDRMKRLYYKNADGSIDMLARSIDCYEKVLYHALRDYDVDYKFAFVDDINLRICVEPKVYCETSKTGIHDTIFNVNEYYPDANEACNLIEDTIKDGKIVAVNTMFDMLPPYTYYKDKNKLGKSNTHYCTLIGSDEKNYFYVDDPSILVKERVHSLKSNETIGIIEKDVMMNAFQKYCSVLRVSINVDKLPELDRFDDLKQIIATNYEIKDVNNGFYIGRNALLKLRESFENETIYNLINEDYFWAHLMQSRRKIFLWCLSQKGKEYRNSDKLIISLRESIENWETLELLIIKQVYWPNARNKDFLRKRMDEIVLNEDKLHSDIVRCVKIK